MWTSDFDSQYLLWFINCLTNNLVTALAGFILMEYLKEKVKDLSLVPDGCAVSMDCCNLSKCNVEEIMSIEELKACIGPKSKKRLAKR